MANQSTIPSIPVETLATLEEECKALDELNKVLSVEVKGLSNGKLLMFFRYLRFGERARLRRVRGDSDMAYTELAKSKSTPTDEELGKELQAAEESVRPYTLPFEPVR